MKILIVDDEELIRNVIKTYCLNENYKVLEAENGIEAIDIINENNDIDYTRGVMHLDGCSLQPGDLDKTFADFGIADKAFLLNVVKADNA